MNILIIEDDEYLGEKIVDLFRKIEGINRVKLLHNYFDFINEINLINSYDVILVDIYLKDSKFTGIDILKIIKSKDIKRPVVMMSGSNDLDLMDLSFSFGANDYLVKPFRLAELKLRIFKWNNSYLKSLPYIKNNFISYNGLIYDLDTKTFFYNGRKIELTKQNKYLLSILLSNKEHFVTKKYIIDKLWGDIDIYNRNIRVSMLRLKRELEKIGISDWIVNIRGEGYIFKK